MVRFWAGIKTEESLQEAHVEGITVTHWIYHEHIEKKLFNADMESQCDVFCSYSSYFPLSQCLNPDPVEVNSCFAFQKDYAPK